MKLSDTKYSHPTKKNIFDNGSPRTAFHLRFDDVEIQPTAPPFDCRRADLVQMDIIMEPIASASLSKSDF